MRRLDRRGIPYTLTPGVPAFAAAAAALQCELTVPEVAQSVVLTRVSGRASRMPEKEKLAAFAATGATLVIHLAIHAIESVVNDLTPICGADCPVAVVVQASSPGGAHSARHAGRHRRQGGSGRVSSAPRSFSSAARSRPRIFATARSMTPIIAAAFAEAPADRDERARSHYRGAAFRRRQDHNHARHPGGA
jgi:hypothetical protein